MMKNQSIYKNFALAFLVSGLAVFFSSCLKKSDADMKPSVSIPFKATDLIKTLAAQSNLHLFYKAFSRLSLAASIDTNANYTIFAPTDSAMKAVGLDSVGINALPIDSLRSLITYQIVLSAVNDNTLTNSVSTEQLVTIKQDILTTPTGGASFVSPVLFIKETGSLYFNGVPVSKSAPTIQTSNGYIYSVSAFASKIPSRTIYDVIQSDPDLSMYKEALDIENQVNFGAVDDATRFSIPVSQYAAAGILPTVLAPTNKAFHDAGFNTADDLLQYANRYYIGPDLNDYTRYYYSSLDTVLKRHILANSDGSGSDHMVRIFYNDLLSPAINNSIFNTYKDGSYYNFLILTSMPLIFSSSNGTAYVNGSGNPAESPVMIPHDASPLHPVNNYICSNGALYKVDKLFYPIPK